MSIPRHGRRIRLGSSAALHPSWALTICRPRNPGSRFEFLAGGGAPQRDLTEVGSEDLDPPGQEMAPPAGGAAAADPGSAAVLLAVHAAVRPLGAGPNAEAQLRRLQLSADPERPGRFRLELRGAGPGAVSADRGWSPRPGASASPQRALKPLLFFGCLLVCKMGMVLVPTLQTVVRIW